MGRKISNMKVQEVMTASSLKYCSPSTKLHVAAKAMKIANCGVLPVVDRNKKIVGIITDRDICLSLAHTLNKPMNDRNFGDIISKEVHFVNVNDDLTIALKQMRVNKVGRLPVVDRMGKLVGILSLHNLLSKMLDNKYEMGSLSDTGENFAKTIKALSDRYTLNDKMVGTLVTAGRSESWEEGM